MAVATRPAQASRAALPKSELAPQLVRLAAFMALAAFAAGHWAAFVKDPPVGRVILSVLVAGLLGAALIAIGRARIPDFAREAAAAAAVLVGFVAGLGAAGLPLRFLGWRNWEELGDGLGDGLSEAEVTDWPYAGGEYWVDLTLLLAIPVLLTIAAAAAFGPAGRRLRGPLTALSLLALLLLYGFPVTEYEPAAPLLRGLVLLVLLAAFLYAPRLRPRQAPVAAATLLAVAVVSLPLAAAFDPAHPVVDYGEWNWFETDAVEFDWEHSYGPIDWPREGSVMLEVEADRPLYWKAETLDEFDGRRWVRSRGNDGSDPLSELPRNPDLRYDERFRVEVKALSTNFVIVAGTPYSIDGAGGNLLGSSDGTLQREDDPLEQGDSYTVRAYVPTPPRRELRGEGAFYPPTLSQYTRVSVPGRTGSSSIAVPTVGSDQSAQADAVAQAFEGSAYARTWRLTQRLVANADTPYETLSAIQEHLRRGYTYSEEPPTRRVPLEAFLFDDKIGYCQQFSGAMALMLRMAGIPARVVSGFSPGRPTNADKDHFEIRDLDAHSWVEAWFPTFGWVTFDPTPAASGRDEAASSPASGRTAGATRAPTPFGSLTPPGANAGGGDEGGSGSAAGGGGGGGPGAGAIAGLALLALAAAGAGLALRRRGRGLSSQAVTSQRLTEFERALPRLGWQLEPGTTLLALEDRLAGPAPAASRYVAALRLARFAPKALHPPGPRARRDARAALSRGGPVRRLKGLLAFPPSPFNNR